MVQTYKSVIRLWWYKGEVLLLLGSRGPTEVSFRTVGVCRKVVYSSLTLK